MENIYGWLFLFYLPVIVMLAVAIINLALGLVGTTFRIGMQFLRMGIGRQNDRQAALTKASYGTVMLLVAGYLYLRPDHFPPNVWEWFPITLVVLVIWGGAWVLIGTGRRSRGDRDGNLIFGFLVRLALGIAALIWVPPHKMLEMPLQLFGLLLVITAAVKLVLVMCGGGSAERRITKLLKQRNAPLVPAKSRRFLFW